MPTRLEAPRPWRDTLLELRKTQTELVRLCPYRDHGLVPNPSATETELADLECRLGVTLPRSHREFLAHSNGWSRLFDGADLLGTRALGDPRHQSIARSLLARTSGTGIRDDRTLLAFGMDALGTTLFAFDYTRGGREPSVLAWVGELGLGAGSFEEFLALLLSLAQRDLEERRELEVQSGAPISNAAISAA